MLTFLAQADAASNMVDADYWMKAMDFLKTEGPGLGLKVVGAIVILIIGRMVAGAVRKGVSKVMSARNVDPSLTGFIASLLYFAVMTFTVIAVVGQFGVQTASFVAILGAAGFADVSIEAHTFTMVFGERADLRGNVEELVRMGPVARLMADREAASVARMLDAATQALAPYFSDGALRLPGAVWFVQARLAS